MDEPDEQMRLAKAKRRADLESELMRFPTKDAIFEAFDLGYEPSKLGELLLEGLPCAIARLEEIADQPEPIIVGYFLSMAQMYRESYEALVLGHLGAAVHMLPWHQYNC
jgi:hypothetical protein